MRRFAVTSGPLSREFVRSEEDVAARLGTAFGYPDPDGRYRIEEFFCHDDTWRLAVTRLVAESDGVLMDLRGFSGGRRGCEFEIGLLVGAVPLSRVVFLVDSTTDMALLGRTAQEAWSRLPDVSPNRHAASPELRLFQAQKSERKTASALCEVLAAAGADR